MRILVVEDDKRTSDYVRKGLIEARHVVMSSRMGEMRSRMASDRAFMMSLLMESYLALMAYRAFEIGEPWA